MNELKPVRTREDLFGWLSLEDVEKEVFAAYVGAKQHALKHDFEADARVDYADDPLMPGTVLFKDGTPWHDRSDFLEYMLCGIVWRLEALAERKGVALDRLNMSDAVQGPPGCPKAVDKLAHPRWNYLAGEVQTITKAEIDAMPPAQRKAMKQALGKAQVR